MDDELASFSFKLCADDYALSPAVSDGILEAISAGRLTSTCAMANQPDWKRASSRLPLYRTLAEFGLHFNLTLGKPLTRMPNFAPGGVFPPLGKVLRASLLGQLPESEIRREFLAQLDAFEDAAGFTPDFIDGHQHVHGLPGIGGWILDEMSRRRLARPGFWLRDSADRLSRIMARRFEAKKALVVALLTRNFGPAATRLGFEINEGFSGYSPFDASRDLAKDFASYLVSPGDRHLVMCHPGRIDDELRSWESVVDSRKKELDFLLSDAFSACLASAGARLAPPPVRAISAFG